jgi:uncharacterized protein YkwD
MPLRRALPALLALLACLLVAAPAAQAACSNIDDTFTDQASGERTILCLVNEYRIENGLKPLVVDPRLATAARRHSEDMVARNYFSHATPEGAGPTERAAAQGYQGGVGENIAYGYGTPRGTFTGWRNSPGHNENMLDPGYTVTGVGIEARMGMATQVFGSGPPPAGGDTGLETAACTAAKAQLPLLRTKVTSAQSLVTKRTAAVKSARAAAKKAKSRSAKAKTRRKLDAAKKALTSARAALASRQKAVADAQRACS